MVINYVSTIFNNCICSSTTQTDNEKDSETPPSKPPKTEEDSCEEYEPHAYGKQQHPTIFWGSIFHLLKLIVGTGILALPYASKQVGYGVAIFGVVLVGLIYLHVLHLLLQVEYSLCKKLRTPNLTYLGVVQRTFEQGSRYVRQFAPVAGFMMYFHYVFNKSISNAIYLITIGGNLKIIVDHYFETNISIVTMLTIIVVLLLPLALIRNLKFLVPMSMFSNLFNMLNIVLILTIPVDYESSGDFNMINNIAEFPYFFGLTLGAFMCTGLVIPLKNDLRDPKKFTRFFGVLNIAILSAILLYCTFGIIGYAKFGDHIQPNILYNLPPDKAVSLIILILYAFAVCISFILTHYTAFDTLWSNIFQNKDMKHSLAFEYILRIFLCILPYVLAVALPDFRIMAGLAGVIAVLMELIIPIFLHSLFLTQNEPKSISLYLTLIKNCILMLICSLMFFAALTQVIRNIVNFYS